MNATEIQRGTRIAFPYGNRARNVVDVRVAHVFDDRVAIIGQRVTSDGRTPYMRTTFDVPRDTPVEVIS